MFLKSSMRTCRCWPVAWDTLLLMILYKKGIDRDISRCRWIEIDIDVDIDIQRLR